MTTSKLSTYSTTAASNNSAAPNGWAEGMLPSDVNNCARENMARVREWYEDAQWINFGHTIVSSTGTTIVVSGDQTAIYSTYRAIRVNQSASQDGWVTSSTYSSPNTTINITGFTVSSPTLVEVGAITSATSLPQNMEMVIYSATFNGPVTAATITASVLNATTVAVSGTLTVGAITCATQAQMETGTATTVPVSPGVMQHHQSAAKAWSYANLANPPANLASYNVASVTRTAANRYRFTWTTAFSSTAYATTIAMETAGCTVSTYAKTAAYYEVTTAGSGSEFYHVSVSAFGDFA